MDAIFSGFKYLDEDGNGQIEVDEYLAWWGDEELIELYESQIEAFLIQQNGSVLWFTC